MIFNPAEDYALCKRARQCGVSNPADTTVRLLNHGGYGYSWEDAGNDPRRYASYTFRLSDAVVDGRSNGKRLPWMHS